MPGSYGGGALWRKRRQGLQSSQEAKGGMSDDAHRAALKPGPSRFVAMASRARVVPDSRLYRSKLASELAECDTGRASQGTERRVTVHPVSIPLSVSLECPCFPRFSCLPVPLPFTRARHRGSQLPPESPLRASGVENVIQVGERWVRLGSLETVGVSSFNEKGETLRSHLVVNAARGQSVRPLCSRISPWSSEQMRCRSSRSSRNPLRLVAPPS